MFLRLVKWIWHSRKTSFQSRRMLYRILRFLHARNACKYRDVNKYVVNEYRSNQKWLAELLFVKVFDQAIADGLIAEIGEEGFKITETGLNSFYNI